MNSAPAPGPSLRAATLPAPAPASGDYQALIDLQVKVIGATRQPVSRPAQVPCSPSAAAEGAGAATPWARNGPPDPTPTGLGAGPAKRRMT